MIDYVNNRYNECKIVQYVIMPNHIHLIIQITGRASPSPTVSNIVGGLKSGVSRINFSTNNKDEIPAKAYYYPYLLLLFDKNSQKKPLTSLFAYVIMQNCTSNQHGKLYLSNTCVVQKKIMINIWLHIISKSTEIMNKLSVFFDESLFNKLLTHRDCNNCRDAMASVIS